MSDNNYLYPMEVWERLCETDPKYTKTFRRKGGFSGTDISPTWRQMLMTQEFGPCGHGWGWLLEKTWSEHGCVFAQVNLWTLGEATERNPGGTKCYTGAHIGGTEVGRTPDEAYKMAITDAFGKCCSALGIGADIYTGQFDSSKYREHMTEKFSEAAKAKEWSLDLDEIQQSCDGCGTEEELAAVKDYVRVSAPPKSAFARLKEMFDATEKRLQNSKA